MTLRARSGLVLSAVLAVLVAAPGIIPVASAAPAGTPHVVLIAVPDLRWSDISASRTPALAGFLRRAAVGTLAVKAAGLPTRAPAGWLTLGAGNRMAGIEPLAPAATALAAAQARNDALTYGARAGALGSALAAGGRTATARGGPGAGLAVAPAPAPVGQADADLTVIEDSRMYGPRGADRAAAAAAVDRDLAPLLADTGRRPRLVLVAGISDGPTGGARLHVAAATGPGFGAGSLASSSTRRAPYVQLIDVAPTVLAALGVAAPPSMSGTPWRSTEEGAVAPSPASLADLDRQARAGLRWAGIFQTGLVWAVLVLVGLAVLGSRATPGWRSRRAGSALALAAYLLAALPAASFGMQLLPWWRAPAAVAVLPAAALAAAAMARAADRWRPGHGPVAIAALTLGVLGADLVSGTHLQTAALLGDSPLIAGRFAGAGNLAFAMFAASGLLLLGLLCRGHRGRGAAVPAAAVGGALGLGVLGAPFLGADAGGLLAATPAVAVLLLRLAGWPFRARWAGLFGLGAGVLLSGVALADYARPESDQTHLGRFVGGLLHGGTGGAAVRRHLESAAHSLISSPFNLLLVLAAAGALGSARGRLAPQRRALAAIPGLLDGLLAAAVAVALGGLVNDSGIAVPGIAACLLVPLMVAVALGGGEPAAGGHGKAGVDTLGRDVSEAAAHRPTSAIRPRPRLPGARQVRGPERYQT